VPILNSVWNLLKPGGVMIPYRSITRIAAVRIPEAALERGFGPLPVKYVRKIFREVGHKFDLRLCIRGLSSECVMSSSGVFEDLVFEGQLPVACTNHVDLGVEKAGRIDGFLLWLHLITRPGIEIDILEDEHCWLPVYLPVFEGGQEVEIGDRIMASCVTVPGAKGVHPDYVVEGAVVRVDGTRIPFRVNSKRVAETYGGSGIYRRLLAVGEGGLKESREAVLSETMVSRLRQQLRERLPEYMVPSSFVALEQLPLTPNGKVDRRALPAPEERSGNAEYMGPRTATEEVLAGIWAGVLGLDRVGIRESFFDLGGDSILSIEVVGRAKKAGLNFTVAQLFDHQT